MRRSKANLVAHELIGLRVKVADSSDPSLVGLEGLIVDETKNTFLLETERGRRRLLKAVCTLSFELDGEEVVLEGPALLRRPEDRIRMLR
ncbi:MAG: ribonuclease P [Nitrososphaerota archaeon]